MLDDFFIAPFPFYTKILHLFLQSNPIKKVCDGFWLILDNAQFLPKYWNVNISAIHVNLHVC